MKPDDTTHGERPILFNGDMVRAILDGRKTQTRRVVKPQPEFHGGKGDEGDLSCYATKYAECDGGDPLYWDEYLARCKHMFPYGKVGDRLLVRETWATLACRCCDHEDELAPCTCLDAPKYKADAPKIVLDTVDRWRPSIHMPRWASRITLEITGVRVERLNQISDDDARAEGYLSAFGPGMFSRAFDSYWDTLAPDGARWSDNPWVWVIEFKRINT